jgi:hypothetical protein
MYVKKGLGIWSEDVVAYFKGLSKQLLERLRETTGRLQSA